MYIHTLYNIIEGNHWRFESIESTQSESKNRRTVGVQKKRSDDVFVFYIFNFPSPPKYIMWKKTTKTKIKVFWNIYSNSTGGKQGIYCIMLHSRNMLETVKWWKCDWHQSGILLDLQPPARVVIGRYRHRAARLTTSSLRTPPSIGPTRRLTTRWRLGSAAIASFKPRFSDVKKKKRKKSETAVLYLNFFPLIVCDQTMFSLIKYTK